MYMLNMVIILIVMYCNVVTAIDKIPMYLLRFNNLPSLGIRNSHSSGPMSRPPLGATHPPFSTAHPLIKIAYSPLERLALTIEDIVET